MKTIYHHKQLLNMSASYRHMSIYIYSVLEWKNLNMKKCEIGIKGI